MDRNTKRNIGASPIANFIREKITQLRLDKGLSEYKLSLDLGHNKSYIQNISLGRGAFFHVGIYIYVRLF